MAFVNGQECGHYRNCGIEFFITPCSLGSYHTKMAAAGNEAASSVI